MFVVPSPELFFLHSKVQVSLWTACLDFPIQRTHPNLILPIIRVPMNTFFRLLHLGVLLIGSFIFRLLKWVMLYEFYLWICVEFPITVFSDIVYFFHKRPFYASVTTALDPLSNLNVILSKPYLDLVLRSEDSFTLCSHDSFFSDLHYINSISLMHC